LNLTVIINTFLSQLNAFRLVLHVDQAALAASNTLSPAKKQTFNNELIVAGIKSTVSATPNRQLQVTTPY
jgi:hypothetical protein